MNEYFVWNSYYINKRILGSGSCAKVYYGIHRERQQEVAIKKISFGQLPDVMKARTVKEINILQSVNHPNIIKLYDYKFDKDKLFLITEYCNGGNLSEWLSRSDKVQPDEILSVIKQILDGFQYLNDNKIIHRDIKPQNILIHEPLTVKICDFGFSQTFKEQISMFKTVCGTPLYMSPEIINMQQYTFKSEIWSIGVLLYYIFFRCHPYGSLENMTDYRSKIVKQPYVPDITIFNDNNGQTLNSTFTNLLKIMFSIDPEKRPDISDIIIEIRIAEGEQNNPFNFEDDYLKIDIIHELNHKKIVLENIRSDTSPPSNSFFNSPHLQFETKTENNIEIFRLDNNLEKGIFENYFSPQTSLKPLNQPQSPPYNIPSPSQLFEPLKTIFSMMSNSFSKF
jgi:serine/threonine protein kinase